MRKKSLTVDKVDKEIKSLMDDMLNTMYEAPGIGLAAVQIGILKQIIVIDISKEREKKNPLFLIIHFNSICKRSLSRSHLLLLAIVLLRLKLLELLQ